MRYLTFFHTKFLESIVYFTPIAHLSLDSPHISSTNQSYVANGYRIGQYSSRTFWFFQNNQISISFYVELAGNKYQKNIFMLCRPNKTHPHKDSGLQCSHL